MKFYDKLMMIAAIMVMANGSAAAFAQNTTAPCNGNVGAGGGQCQGNCGPCVSPPCPEVPPSTDCIGAVGPNGQRYLGPVQRAGLAVQDHYSPNALYAYGHTGLDATRMDRWNRQMAAQNSWHGGYNYWRYGQPMALVVPPTAAFQVEYNWGVAQTRSLPITAQFGRDAAGTTTGGSGAFSNTPYWPSSTRQFGIYPVRGSW